jgi:hypothetical protein
LCDEFASLASHVAKVIIRELFLPVQQKTIPPITEVVGGGEIN